MKCWVVKIGGRLCEDADTRAAFAKACAQFSKPLLIVHGGGAQVSQLQQAMGSEPVFFHGRRVTQASDMQWVEMALSGSVNKALVRALQNAGKKAVGISGCDAASVLCDLVPDLGSVGEPKTIEPQLFQLLLPHFIPVVSPVSLGPRGEAVNVNADELACALAIAVQAEKLLLLSDVSAVKIDGEDQKTIADNDVETLIASQIVTGGMVPKLRSAVRAIQQGVEQVRIAGFSGETLETIAGTCVIPKG